MESMQEGIQNLIHSFIGRKGFNRQIYHKSKFSQVIVKLSIAKRNYLFIYHLVSAKYFIENSVNFGQRKFVQINQCLFE